MLDVNFLFDKTPKGITGTTDVVSTNVYDAGAATKLFAGFSVKAPVLAAHAKITAGTTPTLRVRFVGADDAGLTTNPIIIADTGVQSVNQTTGAALAIGDELDFQLDLDGQSVAKRFYGVIYTQSGTGPTADVTAVIAEAMQSNMPRRKLATP